MRILVALSGGVDSAVAASRLLAEGAEVLGVHLLTGGEAPGVADAQAVATHLEIPFSVLDVSAAFGRIVDGFIAAYAAGRTPNPCVACNPTVKFGGLLEAARDLGCTGVATGHYARRVSTPAGRWRLQRGADCRKDQSYVLYRLSQDQLAAARFPLGSSAKSEVREEACQRGLPVAAKAESQDLCFVPDGDYRGFLRRKAPGALVPGEIVDHDGRVIGRHEGAAGYTVGQRRGLPAVGTPRYVRRVDGPQGRIEVAPREDLLERTVEAQEASWIDGIPESGREVRVEAQIRYAAEATAATLVRGEGGRFRVSFDQPVFAPAPGQALVAYRGDEVLGGGIIRGGGPPRPGA